MKHDSWNIELEIERPKFRSVVSHKTIKIGNVNAMLIFCKQWFVFWEHCNRLDLGKVRKMNVLEIL